MYLLDVNIMEVSVELVLGNGILVINNSNTINSLVGIPTIEIEPTKPAYYAILDKFESFKFITTHYYTEVLAGENGKVISWRKHLTSSEK